jgi:hypothetical protein
MRRGYNLQPLYGSSVSESSCKSIKNKGYDHIRAGVKPHDVWSNGNVNSSGISKLKGYAADAKAAGIGCFIELHKSGTKPFPEYSTLPVEDVAEFYEKFARELSSTDPEYTFIEVVNEPAPPTRFAKEWWDRAKVLLRAMRRGAPDHTLALNSSQCMRDTTRHGGDEGINWDQMDVLAATGEIPEDVDNIVLVSSYYRPMTFTHQGAGHIWKFDQIKGIAYPANEMNCQLRINQQSDTQCKQNIRDYLWLWKAEDRHFMHQMKKVAQWRIDHENIFVKIHEFGAIDNATQGREQYFKDIIEAMEAYNMGWSVWCQGYKGTDSQMGLDNELPTYNPLYQGPDLPDYGQTNATIEPKWNSKRKNDLSINTSQLESSSVPSFLLVNGRSIGSHTHAAYSIVIKQINWLSDAAGPSGTRIVRIWER